MTTPFRVWDFVQCVRTQIAECPLHLGGVYWVQVVSPTGSLQFKQCGRDHAAEGFVRVPSPSFPKLPPFVKVWLQPDAKEKIKDHDCTLDTNRKYQIGSVDDFNRVFFYHQGCDHWHDPRYFTAVEAEP